MTVRSPLPARQRRAAFYEAEARRIETLAAGLAAAQGGDWFARAATEYRDLAAALCESASPEDVAVPVVRNAVATS